MTKGFAYIFINLEQAVGFGHIGWGFLIEPETYCFGSTDHLWRLDYPIWNLPELIRYLHVEAGKNIDFWRSTGSRDEMLHTMKSGAHVRYHLYKELEVEKADPRLALARVDETAEAGWDVLSNNCVHQSYRIITAYGAKLSSPGALTNRFPKTWFNTIGGEAKVLERSRGRIIIPSMTIRRRRAS